MPHITLVEGPVGAGKSTYCQRLVSREGGVHLALDEWFYRLFSPDRPAADVVAWYVARKERLLAQLWQHALALHAAGLAPVLELGLIQRQDREQIYQRADAAGIELKVVVLDAPRDVRRQRVQRRNALKGSTFSMLVPDAVFEVASDLWQPPDDIEAEHRQIVFISTWPEGSEA